MFAPGGANGPMTQEAVPGDPAAVPSGGAPPQSAYPMINQAVERVGPQVAQQVALHSAIRQMQQGSGTAPGVAPAPVPYPQGHIHQGYSAPGYPAQPSAMQHAAPGFDPHSAVHRASLAGYTGHPPAHQAGTYPVMDPAMAYASSTAKYVSEPFSAVHKETKAHDQSLE